MSRKPLSAPTFMGAGVAALCFLLVGSAAEAQTTGAIVPGTPYATVRQSLVAQGYTPLAFPRGGPYDQCQDAAICQAYTEIVGCSGTGMNPCRFAFRAPDGTFLLGVASGETPEDLRLEGIAAANPHDTRGIENLLAGRAELAEEGASLPSEDSDVGSSEAAEPLAPTPEPTSARPDQTANTAMFVALITIALAVYLLPTIIAFARRHRFKWPIAAFNVGAGWSGIGWIWTLVWAVWPERSAMVDPLVGDATGIDQRG